MFGEIEHMVASREGQAMELGWVRDNFCELTTDDYLRMTLKKTCWYTCIHPVASGGIIGSRGEVHPDGSIVSATTWARRSRSRTTC